MCRLDHRYGSGCRSRWRPIGVCRDTRRPGGLRDSEAIAKAGEEARAGDRGLCGRSAVAADSSRQKAAPRSHRSDDCKSRRCEHESSGTRTEMILASSNDRTRNLRNRLDPWKVLGRRWHSLGKGFPDGASPDWPLELADRMLKLLEQVAGDDSLEFDSPDRVNVRPSGTARNLGRSGNEDTGIIEGDSGGTARRD